MDDLINRQAAIDALAEHEKSKGHNYTMFVDVVSECAEIIRDLPSAQPQQPWIPCSERLPDVAQRVLLSGHGQVMVGMLHCFGKYSLEPIGISCVYPKDDIEAWMPLPEPYIGEKKQ